MPQAGGDGGHGGGDGGRGSNGGCGGGSGDGSPGDGGGIGEAKGDDGSGEGGVGEGEGGEGGGDGEHIGENSDTVCPRGWYPFVLHAAGLGTEPQYWNQELEGGTATLPVKTIVAAEHALLSRLVFVVAVSDGAI
jgi:hypothetical protein